MGRRCGGSRKLYCAKVRTLTHSDYGLLALCLWREARSEGYAGQVAVACVVRNRRLKRHTSFFSEIVKPWAFSSMTAIGDSQLAKYPVDLDNQWQQCQQIAQSVADGEIADTTGGATLYWNPNGIKSTAVFHLLDGTSVAFPQSWDQAVVIETVKIGSHVFLREK